MNLEKYLSKNYNFTLQNKHINAKNDLEKIKFKLLNQIGGADSGDADSGGADSGDVPDSNEKHFDLIVYKKKQDEFILKLKDTDRNVDIFLNNIDSEAQKVGIDIKNNKFYIALIEADSNLQTEIHNILSQEKNKLNLGPNTKELLNDIQFGLLKLQVKVILQKFKDLEENIPQINLTKLLEALKEKINSINNFVDNRVENYNKPEYNYNPILATGVGNTTTNRDVAKPYLDTLSAKK